MLIGGTTAWKLRYGVDYKGPFIPFGAAVLYKPSSDSDLEKLARFGSKLLPGIFIGYVQHSGCGWQGDLRILDQEEISRVEHWHQVQDHRRVKASEVQVLSQDGKFLLPIADGSLNSPNTPRLHGNARSHDVQNPNNTTVISQPPLREIPAASEGEIFGVESYGHEDRGIIEEHPDLFKRGAEDYYIVTGSLVVCHHLSPRTALFVPTDDDFPVPLDVIDVTRNVTTDLEDEAESYFTDVWYDTGIIHLTGSWVGKTSFNILRPKLPNGWEWVEGRKTKMQKSNRPPNIISEIWQMSGKKQKNQAIDDWKQLKVPLEEARKKRDSYGYVKDDDLARYDSSIKEARLKYRLPDAPAMPTTFEFIETGMRMPTNASSLPANQQHHSTPGLAAWECPVAVQKQPIHLRAHQDKTAPRGYVSSESTR